MAFLKVFSVFESDIFSQIYTMSTGCPTWAWTSKMPIWESGTPIKDQRRIVRTQNQNIFQKALNLSNVMKQDQMYYRHLLTPAILSIAVSSK